MACPLEQWILQQWLRACARMRQSSHCGTPHGRVNESSASGAANGAAKGKSGAAHLEDWKSPKSSFGLIATNAAISAFSCALISSSSSRISGGVVLPSLQWRDGLMFPAGLPKACSSCHAILSSSFDPRARSSSTEPNDVLKGEPMDEKLRSTCFGVADCAARRSIA